MNPYAKPQAIFDLAISMRDTMYQRGHAAFNGAARIDNMAIEMRRRGSKILVEIPYTNKQNSEPMRYDWKNAIKNHAGKNGIVLQIAQAYNLKSINPFVYNVEYHAIAVVDQTQQGYLCNDPCMPVENERFFIYSENMLAYAVPCGLIIAESEKVSMFPSNWQKQGDGYLAPPSPIDDRRYLVRGGILLAVQKTGTLRDDNIPLEDIRLASDKTTWYQTWRYCRYYWRSDTDCGLAPIGEESTKEIDTLARELEIEKGKEKYDADFTLLLDILRRRM
jgi:hypothetical protein